jgi:hypothetical protein
MQRGQTAPARSAFRPPAGFRCRVYAATAAVAATTLGLTYAGAAIAASPASPAASRPAPTWHIVKLVHSTTTGDFTAVVAMDKTTAFAFGTQAIGGTGTTVPTSWLLYRSSWKQLP